jgi:nucleoside-diphosphate-sugar epimerase
MEQLIDTESQLEERLSRPFPEDIESLAKIDGDLLILGAGGKMGPSLARLAKRAIDSGSVQKRVIAAARFSDQVLASQLKSEGIEIIQSDLLEPGTLGGLPDVPNVVFMAARKFGTSGAEYLTWAMNTYLPALVGERFRDSRIVAFSTGNVYPLRLVNQGGATESTPTSPLGEYAQSALGRERMFEYVSYRWRTPVALLRLNYANDLRYGVLADIGRAVFEGRAVSLNMGLVNVIWQGDANRACLRALSCCQSPPLILNLSGPETLSVRYVAEQFGRRFDTKPVFAGEETDSALLTNSGEAHKLFGYPKVTAQQLIEWTAHWIASGGRTLNKPTHFEVRDGKF